ncbi:unnamed protein product [Darwinula stevensoni]|uniref:Uncharacterized protein n=1 Tax=Darwinula stevensoni TaxID=69355 RepID=A0A7R9FRJ6_9CRUS|nr:unnamed protein product [Darwinula stevensoni]CAG0901505.1 unnamed protein product [Darwinula stevensoni]
MGTSCEEAWCPAGFQCVMAQNLCDALPGECPEFPHCVPEDYETCDDIECEEGHHCIMQEIGCEDCYPVAECVPDIHHESSRNDLLRPQPKMNLLQLMAGGCPLQPVSAGMLRAKKTSFEGLAKGPRAKFLERSARFIL